MRYVNEDRVREILCCNLDTNASHDAIGKRYILVRAVFRWRANRCDRRTYRRESRIKNLASHSIIRARPIEDERGRNYNDKNQFRCERHNFVYIPVAPR